MARRLDASAPGFEREFSDLVHARRASGEDVTHAVRDIIAAVRARGDVALIEFSKRFDHVDLTVAALAVSAEEIAAAEGEIKKDLLDALKLAAKRIEDFHRKQLPKDENFADETGVKLGWRWNALASVGLYVPGGTAAYPSTVLMNAIPARVAGVQRLVMVTPAGGGTINPLVLAAAKLAGIAEIYRVGGAQAVAALAYGTSTIKPVDKIVGPGNAYVAAAKREVFGDVGIDSIAGPSEVLVVADGGSDPAWIAADLLAQAEHDASSQSILITNDAKLAENVAKEAEHQLASLPRAKIARASWRNFGAIITVKKLDDAVPLIDAIAPEHLEIAADDAEALFKKIRNAGAVFLGRHTPEAVGDYLAGPNHVLPTSRTARFSSGLATTDFMKRTSVLSLNANALHKLGPSVLPLAHAEGLEAHARSVSLRLNIKRN